MNYEVKILDAYLQNTIIEGKFSNFLLFPTRR